MGVPAEVPMPVNIALESLAAEFTLPPWQTDRGRRAVGLARDMHDPVHALRDQVEAELSMQKWGRQEDLLAHHCREQVRRGTRQEIEHRHLGSSKGRVWLCQRTRCGRR